MGDVAKLAPLALIGLAHSLALGVRLLRVSLFRRAVRPSSCIATILLLACTACSGDKTNPARSSAAASRAAAGAPDVRACGVAEIHRLPPEDAAVRCAEWFVVRNGYTDQPVADSSELASESIEHARSIGDLVADRRNSLSRYAAVVCRYGRRGPGYTVGFSAPGHPGGSLGRAVTMDTSFSDLRVEHVAYLLARARSDAAKCRALTGT